MPDPFNIGAGVQFVGGEDVDWREELQDDSDDDEELDETPGDVIAILGFDPAEDDDEPTKNSRTGQAVRYGKFDESQHPRDDDGQFSSGGGSDLSDHVDKSKAPKKLSDAKKMLFVELTDPDKFDDMQELMGEFGAKMFGAADSGTGSKQVFFDGSALSDEEIEELFENLWTREWAQSEFGAFGEGTDAENALFEQLAEADGGRTVVWTNPDEDDEMFQDQIAPLSDKVWMHSKPEASGYKLITDTKAKKMMDGAMVTKYRRTGQSVRYDRWVTIGGEEDEDTGAKHKGGFPVLLDDDGNIKASAAGGLQGKHVSQAKEHFDERRSPKAQNGPSGETRDTSNEGLAKALQQGDRDAADELLSKNDGLIGKVVKQYPPGLQDDLRQEARIALLDAANDYDPDRGAQFSTWAFTKMRGAVQKAARGFKRTDAAQTEEGTPQSTAAESDDASDREQTERIREAMEQLPDRERDVLESIYWEDKSGEDIAAEQGVSRQAIHKIAQRAQKRLQGMLGSYSRPRAIARYARWEESQVKRDDEGKFSSSGGSGGSMKEAVSKMPLFEAGDTEADFDEKLDQARDSIREQAKSALQGTMREAWQQHIDDVVEKLAGDVDKSELPYRKFQTDVESILDAVDDRIADRAVRLDPYDYLDFPNNEDDPPTWDETRLSKALDKMQERVEKNPLTKADRKWLEKQVAESLEENGVTGDDTGQAVRSENYATRYAKVHASANEAARDCVQPTEGQKDAGNYRKGKFRWNGHTITLEVPRGGIRSGKGWSVTMPCHYGYINRYEGRDGDQVDVFVGPNPESRIVYVIDQETPGGRFDEHKAMIGFVDSSEALRYYLDSYNDDAAERIGDITELSAAQFSEWLERGDLQKRIAGQQLRL